MNISRRSSSINCVTGGNFSFVMQPIGTLMVNPIGTGTGTATIYVSNTGEADSYIRLTSIDEPVNANTNDYDLTEGVTVEDFSWVYFKMVIASGGTGSMEFLITMK